MRSKEKFIFDTEYYNKYSTFDILYIFAYYAHSLHFYILNRNILNEQINLV